MRAPHSILRATSAWCSSTALLLKWRTILDNVLLPAEIVGLPMKAARSRARTCSTSWASPATRRRYPQQLSGGNAQRTAIARAFHP